MTEFPSPQPAPSWTVSIAGPDDVHRFETELDALRFANQVNRTYLADLLAHPGDEVLCLATVSDASPALPTQALRDTGVETPLLHTDRLNLVGRWFEGRGMTTMAHICRTAAAELKTIADRREEAVAKIVSSGPADMPLLQWLSADHSFRAPIGSRLYAVPPSQPKCLEDLMTKIQAFGLACYQHESGAEQIAMQDEIRRDLAACLAIPAPEGGQLRVWCDTCSGSGKVFQEHQAGCWVGGDHDCPDCDGKGYSVRPDALAAQPGTDLRDDVIAALLNAADAAIHLLQAPGAAP